MSQAASVGTFFDDNTLSNTPTRTSNWKMFMWLFLAQDAMTFFTMFAAYLGLRISQGSAWPLPSSVLGITLTAIMTFLLICSSVTMVQSISAIQRGDHRKMKFWLAMTALGGILFLCGQVYEYTHLIERGMRMSRSLFDATFFILTSFHGLHVFCGVVYLLSVLAKAKKYTQENYTHVEVAGLYWHFVDLVWIILFTLVYLI